MVLRGPNRELARRARFSRFGKRIEGLGVTVSAVSPVCTICKIDYSN